MMEAISWTDRVKNEVITKGQGWEEYPTNNKNKEGYVDWSHLA